MTKHLEEDVLKVALLYPVIFRMFDSSRRSLPGETITARMFWLLQHLANVGPCTLGEIAIHQGISKSTTTEIIDRLVQKHLVERAADTRDQRRVFVGLTPKGEEYASRPIQVAENRLLRLALKRLTAEQRHMLIAGMQALLQAGEKCMQKLEKGEEN